MNRPRRGYIVGVSLLAVILTAGSIVIIWSAPASMTVWVIGIGAIWVIGFSLVVYSPLLVREWQVAIIYDLFGRFKEYKPPGLHFLFLNRKLKTIVSTKIEGMNGNVKPLAHGFEIVIKWGGAYRIDPFNIPDDTRETVATLLQDEAMTKLAIGRVNNTFMRHLPEYDMLMWGSQGIHARVEDDIRNILQSRLNWGGYKILNITIEQITIPPMLLDIIKQEKIQERLEKIAIRQVRTDLFIQQMINEAKAQRLVNLAYHLERLPIMAFERIQLHELMEVFKIHGMPRSAIDEFLTLLNQHQGSMANMIHEQYQSSPLHAIFNRSKVYDD